jgi:hypothetical protein
MFVKKEKCGVGAPKDKNNILVEGVMADLYNPLVEQVLSINDDIHYQAKLDERSKSNQERIKLIEGNKLLQIIQECFILLILICMSL